MTTTEDQAIEGMLYLYGRRALGLFPDMFERGFSFPATDADKETFLKSLDSKAIEQFSVSLNEYTNEQKGKAERKELNLALRIIGHDLVNIGSNIIAELSFYQTFNRLLNPKELPPQYFFQNYTNYRTLVLTMADLGLDGALDFVTKLPVSQLEYLLSLDGENLPTVTCTSLDLKTINSREYVCLYQLVKNVPVSIGERRWVDINIYDLGEKHLLVVRDNGSGILDKDGNPISAERLPEIFGDYSSRKGGGLGLQLVKALVELPPPNGKRTEKGYVSVSTKSEKGAPLFYSTSDRISRTLESNFAPGTEFTLYFRH